MLLPLHLNLQRIERGVDFRVNVRDTFKSVRSSEVFRKRNATIDSSLYKSKSIR